MTAAGLREPPAAAGPRRSVLCRRRRRWWRRKLGDPSRMAALEAWLPEPELAEGQYGDFYDYVITGSGLACLVLERMYVGYGQKTKFSFTVWSRPQVATGVGTCLVRAFIFGAHCGYNAGGQCCVACHLSSLFRH